MKKLLSVGLIVLVLLSFAACGTEKSVIEDNNWKMRTVMSNDIAVADSDAVVIAVGEPDEMYPNAPVTDITLSAVDGKITVTDATNDKVYTGTYKVSNKEAKGTNYEITIDEQSGYATVSPTAYSDNTETDTLIINLGEYSIYFFPQRV